MLIGYADKSLFLQDGQRCRAQGRIQETCIGKHDCPPIFYIFCVSFGRLAWRLTSDMLSMQKWHPDKNLDNPEATAVFQEIQNAYSVSTYKNDGSSSRSPFV